MAQRGFRGTGTGVVTGNPEIKTFGQNGDKRVASFTVAFNRSWKDGNDWKQEVNFMACKAWGRLAEYAEKHLAKGTLVRVDGMVIQESWTKDGKKFSRHVIKAEDLEQVHKVNGNESNRGGSGGQSGGDTGSNASAEQQNEPDGSEFAEQEIPF